MPIYEWHCTTCGRHVEVYQPIAQRDIGPPCHGGMRRVPSAPRLVNAPTGAMLRNQFSLFNEASQELAHHDVDTSGLWNAAKTRAKGLEADGVSVPPLQ